MATRRVVKTRNDEADVEGFVGRADGIGFGPAFYFSFLIYIY